MQSEGVSRTKRPRFFYGWVIVAVSGLADCVALGTGSASFGVFLGPMTKELGWSRITYTAGVTAQSILNLVISPVIGTMLDRFGPRLLMGIGSLVAATCFILMSHISEPWQFYLLYALGASLGLNEIGSLVTSVTVSKWFMKRRGRALAIESIGNNLGQIFFAPLTALLIATFGWRAAWMILGAIILIVVLPPTTIFMRRRPEDMGLKPDGETDASLAEAEARGTLRTEVNWTVRQALRTRAVWATVIGSNLASLAYSGILYHLVSYYTDSGLTLQEASFFIGMNHVFAMAGKVPWGILAEHVPPRYCIMANYAGRATGLLVLLVGQGRWRFYAYPIISGSTSHAFATIQAQLWADYFGRQFVGSIRGVLQPFSAVSSICGPLFAAFAHDLTGSYTGAFSVFVVTLLLASCSIFFATPPSRYPPGTEPASIPVKGATA